MRNDRQKRSVPSQVRDVNSREIFKNPTLCSQFLRDNMDIPQLKQVQPEDIEDVTERYQACLGTEFEADTVKKIRLKNENGKKADTPLFLISLIEHKSAVDYDVMMQLLRYMVVIWHEYAKEKERKSPGISKRKGFWYPPIVPVVYYEGRGKWTASRHLKERIWQSDAFGSFVPDFRYEVIRTHDYSNQVLLDRGDEMSLIMLLNKLQSAEDFHELRKSPPKELETILQNADPHILDIIQNVMYSLMMRINIPGDEADDYVKVTGGKHMGYLFENMEKMDIQAERAKTAEARKQAEEAQMRAEEARKLLDESESNRQEGEYKIYIASCKEFQCSKEDTARRLAGRFRERLSHDGADVGKKALEVVERYWKEV